MHEGINENIIQFLDKQLRNEELSNEEKQELNRWVGLSEDNRQLYNELTNKKLLHAAIREFGEPDTEASLRKIRQQLFGEEVEEPVQVRRIPRWLIPAAAATVLLAVSIYLLNTSPEKTETTVAVNQQEQQKAITNQIPPGGDIARLTLSNGPTIILDSSQRGILAIEESAILHGEKLLHNFAIANTAGEVLYNTLSTPRGYFFEIKLPDDSHVWLSSVSTLRFPNSFPENERRVELSGEAYFEVAKDASRPFVVNIISDKGQQKGSEIEVLGTHFNITAYNNDDDIKATLAEGKIRVKNHNNRKILTPGQQAVLTGDENISIINNVNVTDIVDRKNGLFKYENTPVKTILNQVERMYNISVVSKGELPKSYRAILSRDEKIEDLVETFNRMGDFTCSLNGNTLTVIPVTRPQP